MLLATLSFLALLGSILTTLHLLLHYRQPTSAVAWLFAVWTLPGIGAILYLMFAVYEGPRSLRRRRRLSQKLRAAGGRGALGPDVLSRETRAIDTPLDVICQRLGAIPMTRGNEVTLHPNAETARREVLEQMKSAQQEILLESYIWTPDAFTEEIAKTLASKIAEGVEVKVILDAIGIRTTRGHQARRLRELGVPFTEFLAPNPLKRRFQINFRNHRKLLVVDGKVAITGGRNYASRYFDDSDEGIRDLSIRVRGPAVGVLRGIFLEDWVVGCEKEDHEVVDFDVPKEVGPTHLRVIPHGCDEDRDVYVPVLSAAIRTARSSVMIVTPYFAPGPAMLHDLRLAALSGVEVRLLVPDRTPERWPEIAARRFLGILLEAGVQVYIRPAPFVHAKAIVVDEARAFVGSANFDQRSFYLNYELTCQVECADFARSVVEYFEPDFAASDRIDAEQFGARSWTKRAVENACALFSPIL